MLPSTCQRYIHRVRPHRDPCVTTIQIRKGKHVACMAEDTMLCTRLKTTVRQNCQLEICCTLNAGRLRWSENAQRVLGNWCQEGVIAVARQQLDDAVHAGRRAVCHEQAVGVHWVPISLLHALQL